MGSSEKLLRRQSAAITIAHAAAVVVVLCRRLDVLTCVGAFFVPSAHTSTSCDSPGSDQDILQVVAESVAVRERHRHDRQTADDDGRCSYADFCPTMGTSIGTCCSPTDAQPIVFGSHLFFHYDHATDA